MPYRCSNCQLISKADDNPNCPTRKACNFQRVEVIHFMHSEGEGITTGTGSKTVISEDKEFTVPADLKRCCTSNLPSAHTTDVFFAATCVDCIEFFKALKPELFAPPDTQP